MASSTASAFVSQTNEKPDSVASALRKFRVVRPIGLRLIYVFYPLIFAAALLIDLVFYQGKSLIYAHIPRLMSYLAVTLAMFLFVRLFDQLPTTLRALWDRGSLQPKTPEASFSAEYGKFITQFDHRLNGPGSWIAGVVLLLLANPIQPAAPGENTNALIIILSSLSYFLNGVGLWKLIVIAYTVTRLPYNFHIVVQQSHPDRSGGLGPLGDLCFTNALILLGPALYFVAWVAFASSPSLFSAIPGLAEQASIYMDILHRGIFHFALLALLILELVVFLLPLYEIHREMVRQGIALRQLLDTLAHQMNELNQGLIASVQTLDPAETTTRLDTLRRYREVYENNAQVPLWPFNRTVAVKLLTSQVIPLLSLTGLGKPILDAIGNLINSVR